MYDLIQQVEIFKSTFTWYTQTKALKAFEHNFCIDYYILFFFYRLYQEKNEKQVALSARLFHHLPLYPHTVVVPSPSVWQTASRILTLYRSRRGYKHLYTPFGIYTTWVYVKLFATPKVMAQQRCGGIMVNASIKVFILKTCGIYTTLLIYDLRISPPRYQPFEMIGFEPTTFCSQNRNAT